MRGVGVSVLDDWGPGCSGEDWPFREMSVVGGLIFLSVLVERPSRAAVLEVMTAFKPGD